MQAPSDHFWPFTSQNLATVSLHHLLGSLYPDTYPSKEPTWPFEGLFGSPKFDHGIVSSIFPHETFD